MDSLQDLAKPVRDIAGELVWRQWGALGKVAVARREAKAIIDPEALLLFSLAVAEWEARMSRLIPWWAKVGARLLSVQRVKNLVSEYPADLAPALARFARSAVERGGDHRWRSLAGRAGLGAPRPKDVGAGPIVSARPALMLRLRLAFGVGIKADVLTFLLGTAGGRCTVQQVARATRYYPRAVRRALEELTAAGFALAVASAPISYRVDAAAWADILGLEGGPPPWWSWQDAFVLLAHLAGWLGEQAAARGSDYLRSSRARDFAEAHQERFEAFGIALPSSEAFPGEAYLDPFMNAARRLVERLLDVV